MSEVEPPQPDEPVLWDAPNQQVVRPDESAPWDEGDGGTTHEPATEPQAGGRVDLDAMTKDELLAHAQSIGASPANAGMTKDELKQSIQEAGG
jgi:hypothetical protein